MLSDSSVVFVVFVPVFEGLQGPFKNVLGGVSLLVKISSTVPPIFRSGFEVKNVPKHYHILHIHFLGNFQAEFLNSYTALVLFTCQSGVPNY